MTRRFRLTTHTIPPVRALFVPAGIAAAIAVAAVMLAPDAGAAGKPVVHTSRGNLAVRGYDAVSYWTAAKAERGAARFAYQWQGATWRFASAENRDRFAADPARYAPQFGGYCAYAVGNGYTADGDPQVWKIVDGQLFLNYSRQAQRLWEADIPGFIAKGRTNWPGVLER
jgi:YHS domain-containing protein